jgi:hypothetical protein
MEDGDHSKCPIELLACPDHFEQMLATAGSTTDEESMRFPDFPDQDAIAAVKLLLAVKSLFDEGDPVGSALADSALEDAARMMNKTGLLDALIARMSRDIYF